MMRALYGASSVAVLISLMSVGMPGSAWAQAGASAATPGSSAGAQLDEVVVTGSLIRGTPLDAALPVEVYSNEELERRGAPSALEFAKTLTISGPITGESYYFGGPALTGSVQFNLRGIGANKTLTLLNGRRMNANTANIPSIALARTEILKEGAAVTYGADATGGVVNFITRDHFEGLQVEGQYKQISGSRGDYSLGVMGGTGSDRVNFLWSAEYEHRSRLHALDRDFTHASLDPTRAGYNPAPWSTLTNLAGWIPRGALPAIPSATDVGEFGPAVGGIVSDFTPASCAAVGGRYDNNFTCAYNYIPYYNLVEPTDTYRAYAQLNADVTDNMKFHFDVSYGQVTVPEIFGSPAQPISRGPALATGAVNQLYVPITNPYAAAFAASKGITGAQGFTPVTYRLLGHGGNSALSSNGFGVPDRVENQMWRVSAGLRGTLGEWASFARDVGYDFAVTYNQANSFNTHPDTVGFRLQQALNGFGGPGCQAPDLDPNRFGTQNPAAAGQGACQWWNPFASSFAGQPVRGLANPNYVAGSENSAELTRWLFNPRGIETVSSDLTVDLVFDGRSGPRLPGGQVGWAVGAQARAFESRQNNSDPLFNGTVQCEWPRGTTSANGPGSLPMEANPLPTTDPNFRGCTPDAPGPFVLFAPDPPDYADRQQYSVFAEVDIPILDTLNVQAAVRREEFSGGLGATVYKLAGKWNVWGPLSLRGSYGTNYQTPPVGTIPGSVVVNARTITVAGGNWLAVNFITDAGLKPETAKTWNAGVIWQSRGLMDGHTFRAIVDYFDIRTQDEIGQVADPNQIASLVFNGPGGTITTCDPARQPLLQRITFNAGCAVGMSGVGTFSGLSTLVGNGPGQTTNGFDIQADYTLPVGNGDLSLNLTATRVTELRTGPTSLDGVVVSTGDDRLGTLNFATFAQAAPKLRANLAANYSLGRQNLRVGVNYVSAVTDERPGIQYGEEGEDWITVDLTYRVELANELALTASVANLFDRDPPPAQEELGYDPFLANPLGRTFEIGIRKTF
ncbi:TonB-dependent receptor domain-containing protein [Phenylobacterium deserti]|uniref:TonB-dependent receptor n=1 Tax=Phenylobacterium deserti TaxID=1914756 RepID=A0A328ADU1_9CAUL|nr:TonB-dependent receptor [Phenylobacterium deserti]RAK52801.1 TonB-dependent receptor [Phenylobacterium deserti]